MFRWLIAALSLGALHLFAAGDDLASRVIVLANSNEPESVALAEFYAQQRAIPRINIVALPLSGDETITWREFIDRIYRPLQKELVHRGWIDGTVSTLSDRVGRQRYTINGHHISYLVTCRGVPLRIANDSSLLDEDTGRKVGRMLYKDEAAVDSELSLLAQSGYEITGTMPNPFFGQEIVTALDAGTVIKVSRLDGPTFESARNLVTSALEAERTGIIGRGYVDLTGPHPDGDQWLQSTMQEIEALGFDGEVERTAATFNPAARFDAPVLYFGWYANDLNGPFALEGFKFPPGAIAIHIHSYSARTLRSDKIGWTGPLVARGVTATVGNVFEPYLQLTHRPDLLLQALSRGKNFGDAVYYALPVLSWQSIAVGDPLYCPFKISLEQQERHRDQLPANLAPYVLTREANLLLHQGKRGDAWTMLRTALKKRPGLVLALACAKLAFSVKAMPEGVDALVAIDASVEFHPEDWPLVLQLASLLAAHDARPEALKIYVRLAKMTAPTANDQRALLVEAKGVADAAKDRDLSDEFARQFNALPPPLMAK
jgi:uncharacterized protein (TIGR03790 family)